jgi:hypothetical protein
MKGLIYVHFQEETCCVSVCVISCGNAVSCQVVYSLELEACVLYRFLLEFVLFDEITNSRILLFLIPRFAWGKRYRSWFRHCVTSLRVAVSISE